MEEQYPEEHAEDIENEPAWQCTICGRIGTVGRCCGKNTRRPLNRVAFEELNKEAQ